MSWMPDRIRDDILHQIRDYPEEIVKTPIKIVKKTTKQIKKIVKK